MRLERRIREGAERNAAVLHPDVERSLAAVVREARRRRRIHRALFAAIVLPALVGGVVLAPGVLGGSRGPRLATAPDLPPVAATVPVPTTAVPWTFTRTVSPGLAVVRANGLIGTWEIVRDAQGRMRLIAPRAFGSSSSWPLDVNADELRTSAFGGTLCSGLAAGIYRWSIVSEFLLVSFVDDPCDARIWLLTHTPWRVPPGDRQPIDSAGPVRD